MVRYFTKDVKPIIPASKQNTGAFAAGDLLFDWKAFTLPKGGAKLIGVTALFRSKGDATVTPNNFAVDLIFGKLGTSLGDANGVAFVSTPQGDILGNASITSSNFVKAVAGSCTSIASVSGLNISLTPDDTTLTKDTEEIYYMAGVAAGATTFVTLNKFAESGDADAASTEEITMGGTDMDVRKHFLPEDTVHIGTSVGATAADSAIGTISSADSATQITLTTTSTSAVVANDLLYNINPIKFILHFER